VLTFVCASPGDPSDRHAVSGVSGAASFFATTRSLADPAAWSTPVQITGSWSVFPKGAAYWNGWYPTFMSLGQEPGLLTPTGYVFCLWGCETACGPPHNHRTYASREFVVRYNARSLHLPPCGTHCV